MSVAQWSRSLQQGVLTSVVSTLSLGLVFVSHGQAQSDAFTEECNFLVATADQNLVAFAALERAPWNTFWDSVSQATNLGEVQVAAEQYNIAMDERLANINDLLAEFQGVSLIDPVLEGYRAEYVAVLVGLTSAINREQEAVATVAATETEADLPSNLTTLANQSEIAGEQFNTLANQEVDIFNAASDYCGFTTTVEPPSPLVPFPEESPAVPPSNPGNTGNSGNPSPQAPPPQIEGYDYTEAMLMGYSAAEARDWHTALINFRRALAARPGDRYALAAIANMEAYIADERLIAARRQRFIDLQAILAEAVAIGDWACAAASVDELTTYYPPHSLDRARLVTYRGEITGFIEARDRVENWSTVCPG